MSIFDDYMQKLGKKIPLNILFVCSGNICRSAYADYAFRRMIVDSLILKDKIHVTSAGLEFRNTSIHPNTKRFLLEEGFKEEEIDKHVPRYIKDYEDFFEQADIIIGMTNSHKLSTPKRFRDKFQQLSKLAINEKVEIEDPYFIDSYEEYCKILNQIRGYLINLLQKLERFYL
jgi:protein-tyrosine phosphatase